MNKSMRRYERLVMLDRKLSEQSSKLLSVCVLWDRSKYPFCEYDKKYRKMMDLRFKLQDKAEQILADVHQAMREQVRSVALGMFAKCGNDVSLTLRRLRQKIDEQEDLNGEYSLESEMYSQAVVFIKSELRKANAFNVLNKA